MLVLQLFQHIRIGGVAGFRLFHRGQAKLFKQQLAQLFGGIDIEGRFGIGENQAFTGINPLSQHLAELFQLPGIDDSS